MKSWILLTFLLVGCGGEVSTDVDRSQTDLPDSGLVVLERKSVAEIEQIPGCEMLAPGVNSVGCMTRSLGSRIWYVYYANADACSHEMDHVCYGPKHNEDN